MFIEDENVENKAANVEEPETIDEGTQTTPPVEKIDQTKAFATRLKEEKAKAKQEAMEEIAHSFGYESWNEYSKAQTDTKLIDNGLDPDTVRPVLEDIIKKDPSYIEAMKYKQEKEELEKELFASNSLKALNDKFGTNYTDVNQLDEQTIEDWNKGTPLEKAFASNNYQLLIDNAVKKASVVSDNGKSRLKQVPGSTEQTTRRKPSMDEIKVAKMLGFSAEQLEEYVNRTKK